jgi:6-phosphogluconolactonase
MTKAGRRSPAAGPAALLAALLLTVASPALAEIRQAYLGGYTPPSDPLVAGNRAEGISLADVDSETGAISNVRLVAKTMSPSWLALSADRRFLYAVNEIAICGESKDSGSVSAYAIGPDGGLTLLNVVDSGGAWPCYIAIDPSGKFALVANYIGGSFSVYRLAPDGRLGERTAFIRPDGPGAPTGAPGASRGHMIDFDPSGRYVIGDDAGRNQIFVWTLDPQTGALTEVSSLRTAARTAPRHFVFSPDGKTLYQLMEAASTLAVFGFSDGKLTPRGEAVSGLPDGWAGITAASELLISKDGRRLYFANRFQDTIAVFAVGPGGAVRRIANVHTEGDMPRSLTLDPAGKFLYSLNQRSNNVVAFRIGPDGVPKPVGQFLRLGTPAMMVFR